MKLDMPRVCQVLGWFLLSVLLVSGGTMSILMATQNPLWTDRPEVRHFVPLGHAHAGLLAIVMLHFGLYLERTSLSPRSRTTAGVLYVIGALLLPGGFLAAAFMPGDGGPGLAFLTVPLGGVFVAIAFLMMAFGMLRTRRD